MKGERCPRCGGEMIDGYLVDRGESHRSTLPGWIEGEPRKGWLGGLKVAGKRRLEVFTRRCRKCGLLESFARDSGA